MASTEAPQWLLAAWRRSVEAVGATATRDAIEATGQDLLTRWSGQDRVHHGLKRLIAVLARVDELAAETHDPDLVRLAAWYHGSVFTVTVQSAYARKAGPDADASAELAVQQLRALGVPQPAVARIARLVRGMWRHVAAKDDIDAQALCDADLGILAAEPQRYAAYVAQVRQEYAHIPERDYVEARLAIVTRLLARRALFASPMGRAWERPARDNLRAERELLATELSTMPERDPGQESHVEQIVAAKFAHFGDQDNAEEARTDEAEPEQVRLTASDRVDLARRAARERAADRRAAALADRERRRQLKDDKRRAEDPGLVSDDACSMSRPPTS